MKKFILNADDFGMSKSHNKAVLNGYNNGFLTSASLMANGAEFDAAVHEILPECPGLGVGVHLNVVEGPTLTGFTPRGFLQMFSADTNAVEKEFRAQIEKVLKHTAVDHLDSHVHVHAIPAIFKITAKLAREYEIPFVRTQFEELYFVPGRVSPINLIKVALLNYLTMRNRRALDGLRTNDYVIGVGYTGMMDEKTVEYGLRAIEGDCIVEGIIHPREGNAEFRLTQSKELEHRIKQMGFEFTNYKNEK
jgi:hypothetical protein